MKLKQIKISNKHIALICFIFMGIVCFFAVFFYYINTLKYKKIYDNSKTYYRVLSYPDKTVQEKPIKIVSEFRGNSLKTGVASGVYRP